jgi:tetratricopeptide (TPR) repeat protein
MNAPTVGQPLGSTDQALGLLIEELTARIQAGQLVDVEACVGEHPEHDERLRQLLPALHLLADLGRSAASGAPSALPLAAPGDDLSGTLGDFHIIREVGRGGMGVVYEAEQISLGRRVALKVLPFAAALDGRQLQRFKNEAQAAAHLQHQHIVPVYGVGSERGVHYYAMQFIDGHSLAELIQQLRRGDDRKVSPEATGPYTPPPDGDGPVAATPPVAGLATECSSRSPAFFQAMARLGVQAALALEHAHQLGVVHRDIKPANLLLDARTNLWITDFGLAQVQSDTRLTMTGDLVGTLRYMSPEQALGQRGGVDQRSDLYSLGATLYELLTLEPAFAGRDRQELLRQIAFEEPRPPRRWNPAIPVELETIVLKALAKVPAERYGTAQEMADDLERFLKDEPIRARRPSVVQKVRRWARRHRSVVLTATAGLLLAFAVLAGSVGWTVRDQTIRALVLEEGVVGALGEAKDFCASDRLPEAAEAVKRAEELLDRGGRREDLRRLVVQVQDGVRLAMRLVEIRLSKAAVQGAAFNDAAAIPLYQDAFAQYNLDLTSLAPDEAARRIEDSPIKGHLLAALNDWLLATWAADLPGEERLLAVLERTDADGWRHRLRRAAKKRDRKALVDLARGPNVSGQMPAGLVLLRHALEQVGERLLALEVLRTAQQRHPDDFWINHTLALLLIKPRPGQPAEALRYFQAALALRPGSPGVYVNYAIALRDNGDLAGAIAANEKAIALKPDYAQAHNNLGLALLVKGDHAGAVTALRKAIALEPDYPEAHANLGDALGLRGDHAGAIVAYTRAITLKPDYAEAHNNLGVARHATGDLAGAFAAFQKALACNPKLARGHNALGVLLRARGDRAGAIAACRKAIALEPTFALGHLNLGVALLADGDHAGAIATLQKAIALAPRLDVAHYYLGNALRARGDLAGAIASYRKAVAIDPAFIGALNELGTALRDQGDRAGALDVLRKAIALQPDYAQAHTNIGNILSDLGDHTGALASFHKAIACNPRLATAYTCLGLTLRATGDLAGAIAAFEKAIALEPDVALNHYSLGNTLKDRGDLAGATSAYQKAIAVQADYPEAHCNLGHVLRRQGEFVKALAALRRGHELGSRNPRWRYPSAQWVQHCQRLVDVEKQAQAVLAGKAKPASAAERIELARVCNLKHLYGAAARFYEEGFAEQPGLHGRHRYNAACAAAMAGCGQGDAAGLDEKERARWRKQALAWLRAELTRWTDPTDSPPANPAYVRDTLRLWQRDEDLTRVRDAAALDRLPEPEKEAWRRLWDDVAKTLRTIQRRMPGAK